MHAPLPRFAAAAAVFGLALCKPAAAQTKAAEKAEATKYAISLKVKRLQSNTKTDSTRGYFYYGYNYKNVSSAVSIAIEVRSLAKNPVTLDLEWYFVAKVMSSGKQWICDKGAKKIDLAPPVTTHREEVTSRTLRGSKYESAWINYSDSMGSKIDGYIVIVKGDGKVLKVEASSRPLQELAMSPDKLRKLMINPEYYNRPSSDGPP